MVVAHPAAVYAVPYAPAPPDPVLFTAFDLTWTGFDGSVWDLADPSGGVVAVQQGIVGLHFPAVDVYTSESPGQSGRRRRGVRVKERSIELPVIVWCDDSSEAWIARDVAFWRSFNPERSGTLTITGRNGVTRRITAYLEPDGGYGYDNDPSRTGWALYQLNLTAEAPYWLGDTVSRTWAPVTDSPFFTSGGAPPFTITSGGRLESATMLNPGDVSAWAQWTVQSVSGAVTLTATVAGGSITITVPDGGNVVIDTDPRVGTAVLNGTTDVSGSVNPWNPRPIPAGAEVPIGFTMSGNGIVTASIVPRYFRAIGI